MGHTGCAAPHERGLENDTARVQGHPTEQEDYRRRSGPTWNSGQKDIQGN